VLNEKNLIGKRKERVYLEPKLEEKEMITIKRTHFLGLESLKNEETLGNPGVICS
jgi:hypothetical protein